MLAQFITMKINLDYLILKCVCLVILVVIIVLYQMINIHAQPCNSELNYEFFVYYDTSSSKLY